MKYMKISIRYSAITKTIVLDFFQKYIIRWWYFVSNVPLS